MRENPSFYINVDACLLFSIKNLSYFIISFLEVTKVYVLNILQKFFYKSVSCSNYRLQHFPSQLNNSQKAK